MTIAVRVIVRGRVQGVAYRAWTIDRALELALRGWVRNRMDRSVEALFIGGADAVNAMVELCRRGPPLARVDALQRADDVDDGSTGFDQKPTV